VSLDNYADLTKPDWTRDMSLSMNLESMPNIGDRFAHEYKGWFVPPASSRYRFYLACDDGCHLKLDSTPGSNSSATDIAYTNRYSEFRDYY
jgi:hypothetical protein